MIRPVFLAACSCLIALSAATLRAGEDARRRLEVAQFVAEGAFRDFTIPGVAAVQHAKALADWKRLYAKEAPAHLETDRFLIYGTGDDKKLKDVGLMLDKTYDLAAKTLDMEFVKPWTGKLAVFVVQDRGEFQSLVRILEKRRAEEDEQGVYEIDDDNPHVLAGPPVFKSDLSAEQHAGAQVGAALLMRKVGRAVPHWAQLAFGRASAVRAGPAKDLSAEHKRAAMVAKTRGIKNILGKGSADPEEIAVIQASLMEYLAYSGRTAKFMPFIKGFQVSDTKMEATIEMALEAANLPADKLDGVWKAWVKTLK
ncbi:MAG: hypothetical protein U0793_22305 [Gemmataceae bacterium]